MALELQFQCYLQHNGGQCVEVSGPKQLCLVLKRAELPLTTGIFRTPSVVRPKCHKLQKREDNP